MNYIKIQNTTPNNKTCRVLFIGDSAVGKTNIITRFKYNTFEYSYLATIGLDFVIKNLKIRDKNIKFNIWDTAGQKKYKSAIESYYKNIDVICICYDITNIKSYNLLPELLNEAIRNSNDAIIYIIGNKIDFDYNRCIPKRNVIAMCNENKIHYFEVSAEKNINIIDLFYNIGDKFLKKNEIEHPRIIKVNNKLCNCCILQ